MVGGRGREKVVVSRSNNKGAASSSSFRVSGSRDLEECGEGCRGAAGAHGGWSIVEGSLARTSGSEAGGCGAGYAWVLWGAGLREGRSLADVAALLVSMWLRMQLAMHRAFARARERSQWVRPGGSLDEPGVGWMCWDARLRKFMASLPRRPPSSTAKGTNVCGVRGFYSIAVAPLLTSHWTHLPHHQQQSRRLLQEAAADSGTGVGQGDGQRR